MNHSAAHNGHDDKVVLGFWVYLMSDCVLFASLFATYAVLQNATFGSPAVAELAELPFVLWETLLLLTSSFTVGVSVLLARMGKKVPAFAFLIATLVLGAAFLSMELYEFKHLIAEGHGPAANAAYSAFFTLVGTHGLHVFFGALWGALLLVQALMWGFESRVIRRLTIFSLFWHFLDVVWIFIFTFVYLLGRVI